MQITAFNLLKNKTPHHAEKGKEDFEEKPKDEKVVLSAEIIEKNQQRKEIKLEISKSVFTGPLPHPDILAKYNECYPDAAEIIFKTFERQVDHRISIEKKVINSGAMNSTLGLIAGFLIGVLGVGGGIWLLSMDKSISGYTALFGTLGGLVGTFIFGKLNTSTEIRSKNEKKKRKA